jgi:hypothetical protein
MQGCADSEPPRAGGFVLHLAVTVEKSRHYTGNPGFQVAQSYPRILTQRGV